MAPLIRLGPGLGLTPVSLAVAGALAALWVWPFSLAGGPRRRSGWALFYGAALFVGGVVAIQMPLQAALRGWLLRSVSPFGLAASPWLLAVPLALVAALVQELARLGAIRLAAARQPLAAYPWLGALAGAGAGMVEAAFILGGVGSWAALAEPVLERAGAVALHVGAGAILGAGAARRRTLAALLAVVAVHAAVDSLAGLYQLGAMGLVTTLVVATTLGLGLWLGAVAVAARPHR